MTKQKKHIDRHTSPRIVAHMPVELFNGLREHAAKCDRTISWVVREALRNYLSSVSRR
jgi:predicted DNA-binding protein